MQKEMCSNTHLLIFEGCFWVRLPSCFIGCGCLVSIMKRGVFHDMEKVQPILVAARD